MTPTKEELDQEIKFLWLAIKELQDSLSSKHAPYEIAWNSKIPFWKEREDA